jgi:hypothetical protein
MVTHMSDLPPLPQTPEDRRDEDDFGQLRSAARHLMAAVTAEPVPDRLRDLAIELGNALQRYQQNRIVKDDTPPSSAP